MLGHRRRRSGVPRETESNRSKSRQQNVDYVDRTVNGNGEGPGSKGGITCRPYHSTGLLEGRHGIVGPEIIINRGCETLRSRTSLQRSLLF